MSQKEVAEQLGISTATYNNWESDVAEPKASMLLKLSECFDTDVADLLPSNTKVQIIQNQNNKGFGAIEIHAENIQLRDRLIQQLEAQLQDKERVIQMQNEVIARLQQENQ